MKKKKLFPILWAAVLAVWVLLGMFVRAEGTSLSDTQLYAQAAVLLDADSGRVLYGKNADQVLAMASTTKIMTCIIALEHGDLSEAAYVSAYAAGMPEVKLGVRKGESYVLKDLLYSLMLESHNDAAVVIAEHIGRKSLSETTGDTAADASSEESRQAVAAFAALMNDKAKELGCVNTYFITPNGLDAEETVVAENGETELKIHSTTATELARIMAYCIGESPQADDFLEITQTASYSFAGGNGRSFSCSNHNAFLHMMPGVLSGKTGFTNRAGYCYVGALENQGRTFVVALLACGWPYNKNYKWADTRRLMEYGAEHYFYRSFPEDGVITDRKWMRPIPVLGGQTDHLDEQAYVEVEIAPADGQREELLMKAGEEIVVEYTMTDVLTAPVSRGSIVGHVTYSVEGVIYREERIVTSQDVSVIDFQWAWSQISSRFLK